MKESLVNYDGAHKACVLGGGYLLKLDSVEEGLMIAKYVEDGHVTEVNTVDRYVGAQERSFFGTWTWLWNIDGTAVDANWTLWTSGQPDAPHVQTCMATQCYVGGSGRCKMHDLRCHHNKAYNVKKMTPI